jgi:hypothetical protein
MEMHPSASLSQSLVLSLFSSIFLSLSLSLSQPLLLFISFSSSPSCNKLVRVRVVRIPNAAGKISGKLSVYSIQSARTVKLHLKQLLPVVKGDAIYLERVSWAQKRHCGL